VALVVCYNEVNPTLLRERRTKHARIIGASGFVRCGGCSGSIMA
jgi:hypothetical protein